MQPTVLLVEDDPLNLMLIEQWTEMAGLPAIPVQSGKDALARWNETDSVVMVTDLNLIDMRADSLIETLREQEASSGRTRTPIVLLTGVAPDDLTPELTRECSQVLYKPVAYERFIEAVQRCCASLQTV